MSLPKTTFPCISAIKPLLNIGATLDIPTGYYIRGIHGESLLNGGLGAVTGITGLGNTFKSMLLHYMVLSAASKIAATTETSINTYDSENQVHVPRLISLSQHFDTFKGRDIFNEGLWTITDKTIYFGNKWYEDLKAYAKAKKDNSKDCMGESPFPDRSGQSRLMIYVPTFSELDSLSEFVTDDVVAIANENELGESGGNTIHMRQGLAKMRMLMEMPNIATTVNHYILMTAHIGKDSAIPAGPMTAPPPKKLQHLKQGDKIKGVTDKFTYLVNNCWYASHVSLLVDKEKYPEYPRDDDDKTPGNTDLNIVTLIQLRGKAGPSGILLRIIVSQDEGVLPSLTEFHLLRESDRYGITGSPGIYSLDLLPELKLTRSKLRSLIDTHPKLRRALNITAEMLQMHQFWRQYDKDLICTPAELYADLKAAGFDWDFILGSTRGWWTINNDKYPLPFLSTMDLLKIRAGLKGSKESYYPYWLEGSLKKVSMQLKKPFANQL